MTRVESTVEINTPRVPVPLLVPLPISLIVRPGWKRMLDNSLQNLKRRFEGEQKT